MKYTITPNEDEQCWNVKSNQEFITMTTAEVMALVCKAESLTLVVPKE